MSGGVMEILFGRDGSILDLFRLGGVVTVACFFVGAWRLTMLVWMRIVDLMAQLFDTTHPTPPEA